jgi:AraC-like DNA-binding protein
MRPYVAPLPLPGIMTERSIASESATMTRVRVFETLELLRARYTRQRFAPHAHDEFVFGMVEAGAARTTFRGHDDVHSTGAVITFGPGEVHTGAPANDQGWSYRMLYPSESLVRFVAREATGREFSPAFDTSFVIDPPLAERVRSTHAVLEGDADALQKECALLETIGELVIRHSSITASAGKALPTPRSTAALRRVRELLEAEYARTVTISELAREAGLSTFHLIRVFRASFGLPPYKYLELIRIQQARRLIRHGFPLTHVVHATGFSDQSHLTRYFKRIVGVTPGIYARAGCDLRGVERVA